MATDRDGRPLCVGLVVSKLARRQTVPRMLPKLPLMQSAASLEPRLVPLSRGPASLLDVGDGPAIVCVHGLPGSWRDFRWLAEPLTGRARLIAVDLPGFGQTPVQTGPDPSPEGRAAFVLEVVDALGLDRPLLVGHSMGGVVSVAAVALRPEAFGGLALLASPGLRPHASYARLPRRVMHHVLHGPWQPLMLPLAQRLFAASGFRGYPDAALVRTVACLRQTSLPAHAARLQQLTLPTMTAHCGDDWIIDPPILAELADHMPNGPRLFWPTGGHVPQKTYAAEVAHALLQLMALAASLRK